MRKKLLIILIGLLLISPELVKAETKEPPTLKWEDVDITTDYAYNGKTILGDTGDGYISINNNNEIEKYNYDGKKEKTIISNFNHYINESIIEGDNLIILDNDKTIYKYSLDGELITSNNISNNKYSYIQNLAAGKDCYYLSSNYQEDYIIKLDKNLNLVNEYHLVDYYEYGNFIYFVTSTNEVIIIQEGEDSTIITKLDSNLSYISHTELQDSDEIGHFQYFEIEEISDGYIAIGGRYNSDTVPAVLVKLDENFNVEWIKPYKINYIFRDVEIVSDGYIVIGNYSTSSIENISQGSPVLIKYDFSGNIIYSIKYYNKLVSNSKNNYIFKKLIVLGDDDFIINIDVGNERYYEYYGSIIVRYSYKDYKITTNIKGKGTIDINNTAKEGETVTYSITPEEGYQFKNIKVMTQSGKVIETTDNSFIMPDEDVAIEVEFVEVLMENPKTGNIIMIITGILLITILGTIVVLYYKKKHKEAD